MLATTLIFTISAAAGFTWFKLLRPLASVLELSDETHEMPWGMASTSSQAFGTQDLIPLMTALNVHGGVSVARTARAEEASAITPAGRPGVTVR